MDQKVVSCNADEVEDYMNSWYELGYKVVSMVAEQVAITSTRTKVYNSQSMTGRMETEIVRGGIVFIIEKN